VVAYCRASNAVPIFVKWCGRIRRTGIYNLEKPYRDGSSNDTTTLTGD
jgi:hypothetical protein